MGDGAIKSALGTGSLGINMNKLKIFGARGERIDASLINLNPLRNSRFTIDPVA